MNFSEYMWIFSETNYNLEIFVFEIFQGYVTSLITWKLYENNVESC